MRSPLRRSTLPLPALVLALVCSPARAQLGERVESWGAPPSYTPAHHGAISTLADVTNPLPFIGVSPCRVVDTRASAGIFGGPALVAGTQRNFPIPTGPCTGIPSNAAAYSLNITATQALGAGFILLYPQGGTQPLVSTLNYVAGQTIANAAIVPTGTGGGISVVAGVAGTHLIIDINGYFSESPGTAGNYFRVFNNSSNYSIYAQNASSSCFGPCGIRSDVAGGLGSAAYAIYGNETGNTGPHRGVFGQVASTSTGAAGVWGQAGLAPTNGSLNYAAAGVRGDSPSGFGLLGVSQFNGVEGVLVDGAGTALATGVVGYSGTTNFAFFGTGGYGGTGPKYFVEPHPEKADQVIRYVAMEGPRSYTHITGRARARSGYVRIDIPEDFRFVTDEEDLNAQCTPHGELATCAIMKLDLGSVVFRVSRDVEVSWSVTGIRRTFKDLQPIGEGREYMPESPDARIPEAYSAAQQAMLVQNGTYNPDGTVNMDTAAKLGWTNVWQKRAEQAHAAAGKAAEDAARR